MRVQNTESLLVAASDEDFQPRIRCGVWLANQGRYCNQTLDKLYVNASEPQVGALWGSSRIKTAHSDRPPSVIRPEIRRTTTGHPDAREHSQVAFRWKCKCGRSWTVRSDRFEAAYVDAYLDKREHIVLGEHL